MKKILIAIGIIIVLGLLWYFVSPLVLNKEVNEALPFEVMNDAPVTTSLPADESDDVTEPIVETGPQLVASGAFTDADDFHKGSGDALLYQDGDMHLLRFENFDVTNGPDLRVLLAVDGDPAQSVELDALKGNQGDQNYSIAPSIDVDDYNSVIIYCKPFRVVFSTAALQ